MNAAIPPRFDLRNLRAPWHVGSDGWVDASVKVRNVGRRSGDDTVLAFVVRPDGGRQLVAFPRVRLDRATGPACGWPFAVTQPSGERAVTPGTYRLVVGNLSPDLPGRLSRLSKARRAPPGGLSTPRRCPRTAR